MIETMVGPEMGPVQLAAAAIQPADTSPQVSSTSTPPETSEAAHAASMTDQELIDHVQSKLRPVGEALMNNIPYLREARKRFAQPGRRVPVAGRPTFGEWVKRNLGISDRHVRRLLAAPDDPTRKLKRKQRRDATLDMAVTMAHAVLGLHEEDPDDPSGNRRQAALTNMAFQLLRRVRHKPIAIHVTVKALRPGQVGELYAKVDQCLGEQIDQVFGSLNKEERADALLLLSERIAGRYLGTNSALSGTDSATAELAAPDTPEVDVNTRTSESGSNT